MGPDRRPAPDRPGPPPSAAIGPGIPDRIVVDQRIQVLVFGCGDRRIADATCSATTLLRRAWTHYRWDGRPPPPPMTTYWRSH